MKKVVMGWLQTPSQMDVALWCYKWDGWDWISPGRVMFAVTWFDMHLLDNFHLCFKRFPACSDITRQGFPIRGQKATILHLQGKASHQGKATRLGRGRSGLLPN